MAAAGYPEQPRSGDVIEGLELAARLPGKIFHAGTQLVRGQVVTSGGYNWQSMHDDNIGADPATDDGSNWTIYEIPEAYIYYRLDVLGVVPLSVMEQLGNVWTVA